MTKHRMYPVAALAALGLAISFAALGAAATAGKVTRLELRPEKERATLVLTHTGTAKFRLFKSAKRGTVILEAENVSLPPALTKLSDASSVGGPVLQMAPYNSAHGNKPMAKLVLQLRGEADVTGSEGPGRFTVQIVRKKDQAAGALAAALRGLEKSSSVARDEVAARAAANAKSGDVAKRLIEVLNSPQEEKKYFGSRVTFEAKDADVPDIFRLVGESSELNIIWDPDVEGAKTSLAVKDLPWDQLLDIVIQQKGYKAVVMGNVVRIMTIETFNKQAKARKEEISISDELEPVVMAVVPLSFAEAKDMKTMIDALVQQKKGTGPSATGPGGGGPSGGGPSGGSSLGSDSLGQDFVRGKIEVDARTNSLIITNTKDAIDRIRRLVRELDVAVPQILIDAKIVIATDAFSKSIGVRWQGNLLTESGSAGPAAVYGDGTEVAVGGGSNAIDAAAGMTLSGSTGAGGLLFGFGSKGDKNITAALALSELNRTSKTVASPRVIVNNNTKAEISDGTSISSTSTNQTGTTTNNVSAELKLTLTPQVTSRGSVQLKGLQIERGVPVSAGNGTITTDKKKLSTEVLVDSGSTLVLGGVYQQDRVEQQAGLPLLKDLPFVGWFFRENQDSNTKSELMVFITPQIVDPEGTSQSL